MSAFLPCVLAAAVALGACAALPLAAQSSGPAGAAARVAGVAWAPAPCPFPGADTLPQITCGTLTVPERWDRADGPTLRLMVARVPSVRADPAPDPVVFLDGGPGFGSVRLARAALVHPAFQALRADRELLLVDPRGTGHSEPGFCREEAGELARIGSSARPRADREAAMIAALRRCGERLRADGRDPSAYGTDATVRDLDALRRALGIATWNLYGFSYGTRPALEALRRTPDAVRAVVIAGPAPFTAPGASGQPGAAARALALLEARCAADAACRGEFPALGDDVRALLAELARRPLALDGLDTTRFVDGRLVLDERTAISGMVQLLYDRKMAGALPAAVRALRARDANVLRALAQATAGAAASNVALGRAVLCYEDVPFDPPERVAAARAAQPQLAALYDEPDGAALCGALHDRRADDAITTPVESDVPTLVLVGEHDPVTPPANARLAVAGLTRATIVELPGESHRLVVSTENRCQHELIRAFLADPARPLDTGCTAAMPPIRFLTGLHAASGVGVLATALAQRPSLLALLALVVALLGSAVLAWPLAALLARRRGGVGASPPPRWPRLAAGTAAVAALAFVVGLAGVVREALGGDPLLLAFGVPRDAAWLFVLPWLVAGLALPVAAAAVAAWRGRWWGPAGRAHYTLVAAACLAFVGLVARFGLLQ